MPDNELTGNKRKKFTDDQARGVIEQAQAAVRGFPLKDIYGDVGDQIAGFFDGGQIDPASTETQVSRGYSI
jgi:hypothetical protein